MEVVVARRVMTSSEPSGTRANASRNAPSGRAVQDQSSRRVGDRVGGPPFELEPLVRQGQPDGARRALTPVDGLDADRSIRPVEGKPHGVWQGHRHTLRLQGGVAGTEQAHGCGVPCRRGAVDVEQVQGKGSRLVASPPQSPSGQLPIRGGRHPGPLGAQPARLELRPDHRLGQADDTGVCAERDQQLHVVGRRSADVHAASVQATMRWAQPTGYVDRAARWVHQPHPYHPVRPERPVRQRHSASSGVGGHN